MIATLIEWFGKFAIPGALAITLGILSGLASDKVWLGWLVGVGFFVSLALAFGCLDPWLKRHKRKIEWFAYKSIDSLGSVAFILVVSGVVGAVVTAVLAIFLREWNWPTFGISAGVVFTGFVVKYGTSSPGTPSEY